MESGFLQALIRLVARLDQLTASLLLLVPLILWGVSQSLRILKVWRWAGSAHLRGF